VVSDVSQQCSAFACPHGAGTTIIQNIKNELPTKQLHITIVAVAAPQ